jgi:hypothetical protein
MLNYLDCIKHKPWLKIINRSNITDRLLKATKGQAFIVFNIIQQSFELHTVEAYILSGDSYNTSVSIDSLNQFIINDYQIKDMSKNLLEVESEHMLYEYNKSNKLSREKLLEQQFKTIERVIGTNI